MASKRAARAKATQRIQTMRRATVIAVAVIAAALGALGLFYGTGLAVGDAEPGKHYRVLEDAPAGSGPVEVVEYFSYACVHCRNFDPLLEDWSATLPEGATLRRAHVAFSPALALLAQAHVALRLHGALAANHERIFRALHDRGRQFTSAEAIADYVDGHGIERAAFLALVNAPRTVRTVQENEIAARAAGVVAVPTLVVAEKYVVNMDIGRKQALGVAESLVRAELAARAANGAPAAGAAG